MSLSEEINKEDGTYFHHKVKAHLSMFLNNLIIYIEECNKQELAVDDVRVKQIANEEFGKELMG